MCRSLPHYSKHMHTPITAAQLDVSVTTQCNILLSQHIATVKRPKFDSDKTAVGPN